MCGAIRGVADIGGPSLPESRFQSFAASGGPGKQDGRVAELRRELESLRLQGFIVPRADEHQNEYVPANAERLQWLTGFGGSAGIAVVLKEKAALFVDGRYTEQAKSQVDASLFELRHLVDDPPAEWIGRTLRPGERLGYDPRLHTPDSAARFASACRRVQAELVAVDVNPIDAIWKDRPGPPLGVITQHKGRYAGESAAAKIAGVRAALTGADGLLITDPHNLAWLFNIRGADVSHTPLPLGFAYVPAERRPTLFLDFAEALGRRRGQSRRTRGTARARRPRALCQAARSGRSARPLRRRHGACLSHPGPGEVGREGGSRQGSSLADESRQEQGRIGGSEGRPSTRRRGNGAVSGVVRC